MSVEDIVTKHMGWPGNMLSASKRGYHDQYPDHVVFFNGNIYDHNGQKIWFGDIDITIQSDKLQALADELKHPIYVTRENPYRFMDTLEVDSKKEREIGISPSIIKFEPKNS